MMLLVSYELDNPDTEKGGTKGLDLTQTRILVRLLFLRQKANLQRLNQIPHLLGFRGTAEEEEAD